MFLKKLESCLDQNAQFTYTRMISDLFEGEHLFSLDMFHQIYGTDSSLSKLSKYLVVASFIVLVGVVLGGFDWAHFSGLNGGSTRLVGSNLQYLSWHTGSTSR